MASYIRLFGNSDTNQFKKKIRFFVNDKPYFITDKNDILLGRGFGFKFRPPKIKFPNFKFRPPKLNIRPPKLKFPNFKTGGLKLPQFNGGKFFGGITHGLSTGLSDLTDLGTQIALAPTNLATGVASGLVSSGMNLLQTANPLLNAATGILSPGDSGQAQSMDDGSGQAQPMDDGSGYPMDDGSGYPMDDGSGYPMDDGSGSLEGIGEMIEEKKYSDSMDSGEFGL